MPGKLIVLEGVDGSGKSTQFKRLCERLDAEGIQYRSIVFPRYEESSSALVRMYLGGQFGENPMDVSPYAASTFYAVDRYASYQADWKAYYEEGGLVLCDRYTTANALHQGAKLADLDDKEEFFDWLDDFEHRVLGLPRPDLVVYLDVDIETIVKQLRMREQESGKGADIHERDVLYLSDCRDNGVAAATYFGWDVVQCERFAEMRDVEEIHEEIFGLVMDVIES